MTVRRSGETRLASYFADLRIAEREPRQANPILEGQKNGEA